MEHSELTPYEAIAYKACQDCNLAHNSWVNYPETHGIAAILLNQRRAAQTNALFALRNSIDDALTGKKEGMKEILERDQTAFRYCLYNCNYEQKLIIIALSPSA